MILTLESPALIIDNIEGQYKYAIENNVFSDLYSQVSYLCMKCLVTNLQ